METNKWIYVDNQLPEEFVDVLLQFEDNMAVGFLQDEHWVINTGNGMCEDLFADDDQPIAWMTLPSPVSKNGAEQNTDVYWIWVWEKNRIGWVCSGCGHMLSSRYIRCEYCPNRGRRCF